VAELVKAGKLTIPVSEDGRTPNVRSITVDDLKGLVDIATVKLNANGGTVKTKTLYFLKGDAYSTLSTPTRKGYTFSGWYTKKTEGKKVGKTTKAATGTLYARWAKVVKPAKVQIKSITAKKASAVVTVKSVKGAVGYRITYSTDKSFKKGVKTVSTTKASATVKKLTSGKTYYVKVEAYKKDSAGAKVYGKASSVGKVKVK
jgi:2',3'-cyclic-nucleotide 2'-phosphodiesterase/3'-nucleotidase